MAEMKEPTPDNIKAAREYVGDTQAQAAARVHAGYRGWQEWEAGNRAMHPGLWELYLIKTGQLDAHTG